MKSKLQNLQSFLDRPVTRRDALKLGGAVALLYGIPTLVTDWQDAEKDNLNQYSLSTNVTDTLEFMLTYDIKPPQDTLYGFSFPSTTEVAKKYADIIQHAQLNPDDPNKIIVVEEKNPTKLMRRVRQFLGIELKPTTGTNAEVHGLGLNIPVLFLSPDFATRSKIGRATTLYHEGLHLSYQERGIRDPFELENMPYVGEMLLTRTYLDRGYVHPEIFDLFRAYEQAVLERDPKIWEVALKVHINK